MRIELAMASSLIEGRYNLIDRDKILLKEYDRLKKQKPDDILYSSQLAGHNACNEDDYETIEYEAGMLALFMKKNGSIC